MRATLFILTVLVLTLIQAGCATSFRAGGRTGAVDSGTALPAPVAPIVVPDGSATPPPPLAR
jgi:hypothetical protein